MKPAKFRKKSVVIEAMQFTGEDCVDALKEWGVDGYIATIYPNGLVFFVTTLEGHLAASVGDWVINGIQSEFYLCEPGIFEATYESVPEAE